ncbi:unnamed protein product [Effrenium voratum]|nr:unnamed protein product [Effrenium voratum]
MTACLFQEPRGDGSFAKLTSGFEAFASAAGLFGKKTEATAKDRDQKDEPASDAAAEPAEEIDTEEEGNGKAGWIYVTPEIPPTASDAAKESEEPPEKPSEDGDGSTGAAADTSGPATFTKWTQAAEVLASQAAGLFVKEKGKEASSSQDSSWAGEWAAQAATYLSPKRQEGSQEATQEAATDSQDSSWAENLAERAAGYLSPKSDAQEKETAEVPPEEKRAEASAGTFSSAYTSLLSASELLASKATKLLKSEKEAWQLVRSCLDPTIGLLLSLKQSALKSILQGHYPIADEPIAEEEKERLRATSGIMGRCWRCGVEIPAELDAVEAHEELCSRPMQQLLEAAELLAPFEGEAQAAEEELIAETAEQAEAIGVDAVSPLAAEGTEAPKPSGLASDAVDAEPGAEPSSLLSWTAPGG